MKKILLAFDGQHYCQSSLDFALQLHQLSPVLLTGAFLPQTNYASLWSYATADAGSSASIPLIEEESAKTIQGNMRRFETFCNSHDIKYRVHKSYFNFALPELKREARFADVVLISATEFYKQDGSTLANPYMFDALHEFETPVLLLPGEKVSVHENIILTYDGSAASVYAMKQFFYLFPELLSKQVFVVYAGHASEQEWPEEDMIRELINAHCRNVRWERFFPMAKKYFTSWIMEHKNSLLVTGAFGRSRGSMLFKKSFITEIFNEHLLPIFVAH